MQSRLQFPGDDSSAADVAEKIVRGNVTLEKLLELSDSANGGGVEQSGDEGYYAGSMYQSDGSAPLTNPKHERFLEVYLATGKRDVAYRTAISGSASVQTAQQQASRMMKRAEIQARLRFLISDRKRRSTANPDGRRMSSAEKLAELETIIKTGSPSDRVRAIQEHNRLQAVGSNKAAGIPDPAYLADFMRRAGEAGRNPVDLANDERGKSAAGDDSEAVVGHSGEVTEPGVEEWENGDK